MRQPEAGSSLPAQFLHHVTRRRSRVYGAIGVALVLLSAAFWIYGGFAMVDFTISVPRPPEQLAPHNSDADRSQGANGATSIAAVPPPIPTLSDANGVNGGDGHQTQHGQAQTQAQTQTAPPQVQQTGASDDWRHSNQSPAANVSHGIPPKIWQILLPKKTSPPDFVPNPKILEDTPSWLAMNPDYTYTLVGQKGGEEFVRAKFGDNPKIVEAFTKMPNVGQKSDLLRYLLLEAEGGVYSDTDTVALKPINKWVPEQLKDKVNVVVGIEFDRRDGGGWADINHWVQFCQWTIAAAPGHPVFRKMVDRILVSLDDLARAHNVPSFADLEKLKSFEVMNSTGPAAWTDVVFSQLQEFNNSLTDTKDLSFMTEPRLIGDILILPIDGFGMGQVHSNSTHDGTIPEAALVKHLFKGAWRGDKRRHRGWD
ncbi:hypothetical protein VTI74DRAFT_4816 [Chaetomium olivicolor]